MNKPVQAVIITIFLAALVFLITIVGILMLFIASVICVVIALLIERARNKKEK